MITKQQWPMKILITTIIFIKMIARVLSLSAPPAGRPDSPGNSTHYGGGGDYDDDNDDNETFAVAPEIPSFPIFLHPPQVPESPPGDCPAVPTQAA